MRVGADARPDTAASPQSDAPQLRRLSIVVLPFANLSSDIEEQYFADGITEDLTTNLSRIANMFVISRNTAFTYRNKRDKGTPLDTYHAWTREWMTFPNGAHVVEVELDRDTGQVSLARYTAVDDYGCWSTR